MPPKRKSASAAKSSAAKKAKADEVPEKKEEKICTVVVKGSAPVDAQCPMNDQVHVYASGSVIYDAMLNQTNLQFNNNKYYVIQLLESDSSPSSYFVWFRWGRVGKDGMTKLERHASNLEKAIGSFKKKFYDKTRNGWPCGKSFVKVPGKYDLLEMDYSSKDADETGGASAVAKPAKKPALKSSLSEALFKLIDLICDIKVMEKTVVEMKYDSKKAPLGRLTKEQIKAGFSALKAIEEVLEAGKESKSSGKKTTSGRKSGGGATAGVNRQKLLQACNDFYTRIPHDFGMRVPPLINTLDEVKEKLQLLEALSDIEIAMQILNVQGVENEHPADRHYSALKCSLDAIDHSDKEFDMLQKYLINTHGATHGTYTMELLDVFRCEKEGEAESFNNVGNRKLLWHGSRLSNWMGILSQGLRIAPPEAPSTGYMFGKGVYFADMSSKSANYTYANRANNVGLMVLCEVALGKPNQLFSANFTANKLPSGCHSVMGMGRTMPDPTADFKMDDGVIVPFGKPKDTGVNNPSGYTLLYNEYIVYNTNQIRMRYVLKVKFNYK